MLSINMGSFTECKKILKKNGFNFTDDEIHGIKELLEFYAELSVKLFKQQLKNEKCSNNVSS